jgi:Sortase domain
VRRAVTAVLPVLAAGSLVAGCGTGHPAPGPAGRSGGHSAAVAAAGRPSAAPPGGRPAPAQLPASVPVRLLIPAIGVDTPVMRLGLAPDGTVQVPPVEAHAPAGWYGGSPTPGRTGPSVILAHVTVGRYGDGVFVHLARLERGDRVTVRLKDGASAVFTVDEVRTVAKAHFPTSAVYGDVDRPELRLITCGGPRDSAGTGYLDNVVVYASLSSPGP